MSTLSKVKLFVAVTAAALATLICPFSSYGYELDPNHPHRDECIKECLSQLRDNWCKTPPTPEQICASKCNPPAKDDGRPRPPLW